MLLNGKDQLVYTAEKPRGKSGTDLTQAGLQLHFSVTPSIPSSLGWLIPQAFLAQAENG